MYIKNIYSISFINFKLEFKIKSMQSTHNFRIIYTNGLHFAGLPQNEGKNYFQENSPLILYLVFNERKSQIFIFILS